MVTGPVQRGVNWAFCEIVSRLHAAKERLSEALHIREKGEWVKYMTVVPAYSRDYKSEDEARSAWLGGKDFRIADISSPDDGRYTSARDWTGQPVTVNIRYDKLRHVAPANMTEIKPGDIG